MDKKRCRIHKVIGPDPQRWKRHRMWWGATNIKTAPDSCNIYQSIVCIYFTQNLTLFYSISLIRNIVFVHKDCALTSTRSLTETQTSSVKHEAVLEVQREPTTRLLTAESTWAANDVDIVDDMTTKPDSGAPLMGGVGSGSVWGQKGFVGGTQTSGAALSLKKQHCFQPQSTVDVDRVPFWVHLSPVLHEWPQRAWSQTQAHLIVFCCAAGFIKTSSIRAPSVSFFLCTLWKTKKVLVN